MKLGLFLADRVTTTRPPTIRPQRAHCRLVTSNVTCVRPIRSEDHAATRLCHPQTTFGASPEHSLSVGMEPSDLVGTPSDSARCCGCSRWLTPGVMMIDSPPPVSRPRKPSELRRHAESAEAVPKTPLRLPRSRRDRARPRDSPQRSEAGPHRWRWIPVAFDEPPMALGVFIAGRQGDTIDLSRKDVRAKLTQLR